MIPHILLLLYSADAPVVPTFTVQRNPAVPGESSSWNHRVIGQRYPTAPTMLVVPAASPLGADSSDTSTRDIRLTCSSNRFVLSAGSSMVRRQMR